MKPESFGRRLGIGVRVAAHMVQERAAEASQRPLNLSTRVPDLAQAASQKTRTVAEKTKAVGRASKRFGEALWGPVVHLGGVLWLEITGLFFAIFALYFAQNAYQLRHAYRSGAEHQRFLLYVALTLIFAYFTTTSFYRARRKERKQKR